MHGGEDWPFDFRTFDRLPDLTCSPVPSRHDMYTGNGNSSPSNVSQLSSPAETQPIPSYEDNTQGRESFTSVSATFHPSNGVDVEPPDLVLLSADHTLFHVHSRRLLSTSTNGFNKLLPVRTSQGGPGNRIQVRECSSVLNVLLHTAYSLSFFQYRPSLEDLDSTVAAMKQYGLPVHTFIAPSTPLFLAILFHAPTSPLEVYTLAASNNLHDLAVSASPHLLPYPLHSITDKQATAMGTVYLKKLFALQQGRTEVLKRLLLPPPYPHPETGDCKFADQRKVSRAWTVASAHLAWEVRADLPASKMEAALLPLADDLPCDECKAMLKTHVRELVAKWAQVKSSI